MTIHHSAILRPYADEMLHGACQGNDLCRDCRDRAWLEWDEEESKHLSAQESEDALDHARDEACLDCGKTYEQCSCAPDTHRETIDFAYCAR